MNTNEVEARLESLAAQSASPALPIAILDRMAELEAGAPPSLNPVHSGGVYSPHRIHLGRGPQSRGLMLLGAAAALALVGGLVYAGGSRLVQTQPDPTQTLQSTRPVPVQTLPTAMPVQPEPAPPYSLGTWKNAYTFSADWQFGHIWGGGPFSGVQLSWQNDEIVGLAVRYNDAGQQQNCVLQSKDGSSWSCSELPTPTGEACGPGPCPDVTGLAVRNGRWVAVGVTNNRSPSTGDGDQNAMTLLTWTSNDGFTWKEQASARSTPTYGAGLEGAIGDPNPPTLLTTGSGFVTSRCSQEQPGIWTSTDGMSWQPAVFAGGLGIMHCAVLSAHSTAGYMATGFCPTAAQPYRECVAVSADGVTWTTSDPTTVVSPVLAGQLRIYQVPGPTYVDGRWIVVLDNALAANPTTTTYYEASSADGVTWSMSLGPEENYLSSASLNESDYHPAMFSQLAQAGYWGVNNGPFGSATSASPSPGWTLVPAGSKTYWSPTGIRWQAVSDAPPGWPVAVVETPNGLVVFMNSGSTESPPTTTVWVAAKR